MFKMVTDAEKTPLGKKCVTLSPNTVEILIVSKWQKDTLLLAWVASVSVELSPGKHFGAKAFWGERKTCARPNFRAGKKRKKPTETLATQATLLADCIVS